MKTTTKAEITAVNAENLEDIIFEGRNQNYGAYSLRKSYNNHLNLSLLIVLSFAAAVAVLAFVHTMMTPQVAKVPPIEIKIKIDPGVFQANPELPEPPAKKASNQLNNNTNIDAPPLVVTETTDEDQPMLPNDDINDLTGSTSDPGEIPTVEPPVTDIPTTENPTYNETQVTTQALFGGGSVENFRKWLSKNISYPEDAISNDLNGKVFLQFTVDKTGELIDIKIIKGLHPVIDQAAIRALSKSPKWTAATLDGKPVKVSYYLPISFCILK